MLPTQQTFFCIRCGGTPITKVGHKNANTLYLCSSCGERSERFVAWDPEMVQYFNDKNELVHGSVGVIVQNTTKEILLFKRVKYPFLWTIPAGHVGVDEDPSQAALRELYEETQLHVTELQPVFTGEIRGDSCVGGADIHFWHAYICRVEDGIMPTIEETEGREWGWFPLNEIPSVTMPVDYLLALSQNAPSFSRG